MVFLNRVTFRCLKKGATLGTLHGNGGATQPNFFSYKNSLCQEGHRES